MSWSNLFTKVIELGLMGLILGVGMLALALGASKVLEVYKAFGF